MQAMNKPTLIRLQVVVRQLLSVRLEAPPVRSPRRPAVSAWGCFSELGRYLGQIGHGHPIPKVARQLCDLLRVPSLDQIGRLVLPRALWPLSRPRGLDPLAGPARLIGGTSTVLSAGYGGSTQPHGHRRTDLARSTDDRRALLALVAALLVLAQRDAFPLLFRHVGWQKTVFARSRARDRWNRVPGGCDSTSHAR